MGNETQIDWAGMTPVVKGIRVGANAPGQTGTELTGSEITLLDGLTAGTVTASKAVTVDSSKNVNGFNAVTITGPVGTGAASAGVLNLNTLEATVVDDDQLGRIDFKAQAETGADAILVAASIWAEAEATFDATTNTTALVFATGTSEAAAEKTRISGNGTLTHTASLATGATAADRATIKGIYMTAANVAVTVPSIANDAAENVDSVDVDVSAALTYAPAVGDAVIAIPQAALPTDCLQLGAYVTNTDTVTVTFGSKEGGSGVTGAAVNYKFLFFDLT